jgi:DNA-binding GntR family transcriptional regulator
MRGMIMSWYQSEDLEMTTVKDNSSARIQIKETILQYLRTSIIEGELSPGKKLYESELCKLFGASRSPVREALVQLEQEGLIQTFPKKGSVVTEIDERQLRQALFIRSTLESTNIELLAKNITKEQILVLKKILEEQYIILKSGSFAKLYNSMDQFHYLLFQFNGLPGVWELIRREKTSLDRMHWLHMANLNLMSSEIFVHPSMDTMCKEHFELVDALEVHDREKCISIIQHHANFDFEMMESRTRSESLEITPSSFRRIA